MSKLKNRDQKQRPDARTGGFRAERLSSFMQGPQGTPVHVAPWYIFTPHSVLTPVGHGVKDNLALLQAQSTAMTELIACTYAQKPRKMTAPALATMGRRATIERFGSISIHTAVVDTPSGPCVRSALDCDDVWYGSPGDLSDEELASFGLGG